MILESSLLLLFSTVVATEDASTNSRCAKEVEGDFGLVLKAYCTVVDRSFFPKEMYLSTFGAVSKNL